MLKSIGIVLSKKEKFSQVCILDKTFGKIFATIKNPEKIIIGSILEYSLSQKINRFKISNSNICFLPEIKSINTIIFLHHFLELIYFFIQEHEISDNIFELTINILKIGREIDDKYQQILICKLLLEIGIITEKIPSYKTINIIREIPVDILPHIKIDLSTKRDIKMWIIHSLKNYIPKDKLQTIKFINYLR